MEPVHGLISQSGGDSEMIVAEFIRALILHKTIPRRKVSVFIFFQQSVSVGISPAVSLSEFCTIYFKQFIKKLSCFQQQN